MARRVVEPVALRSAPTAEGEPLIDLIAGDMFAMLDDNLGWAWGYAGDDRVVGYVRSETLGT